MRKINITILMFFILLSSKLAFSHNETKYEGLFGFGGGSFSDSDGIVLKCGFDYAETEMLYSFRYNSFSDEFIFSDDGKEPDENFNEYGLLCGKIYKGAFFDFSFSGGLSFITGTRRGKYLYTEEEDHSLFDSKPDKIYESNNFNTVGAIAEIDLSFVYFKYFNIGIQYNADFNKESVYFGGGLYLSLSY